MLLVCNKGDATLGMIDVESGKQVAAVPVGGVTGHEVAVSSDGRTAYVPIYGDGGVGKPGTDGSRMVAIDIAARPRPVRRGASLRPLWTENLPLAPA